ncbi:MAG: SusC/RagA family TonB-linked outer membrane protein [Bacteroidetes bacterium]|nr:SusC/RagA family TonB-linked outer membrane protein [Bacteroidota bacterium]
MRYLLVFIAVCFSAVALGQKKDLKIILNNVTVKAALETLEEETGLSFWFNTQDVDLKKIISVNLNGRSLDEALEAILSGQEVSYELKSDHIIISRKKNSEMQVKSLTTTVNRRIKGLVLDEAGNPMPDVIVRDRLARIATSTDDNGHFSLSIPVSSKTLLFSFVGMASSELPVANDMVVRMERDEHRIKEFVVTALDVMRKKRSLPYASQSIDEDEISKGRNLNFTTSLSGLVAGMNVLQAGSGSGGSTKLTLRGTKNITSTNQPLFVIDGVPVPNTQTSNPYGFYSGRDSGDGLSNINPDEIQSVTILKGANAAALYGSQGSNGVVLITTKKGAAGTTAITLNSSVSLASISEYPALQYIYGQTSSGSEDSWGDKGSYRNILNDFFRNGLAFQNSVALSAGNEKITTYLSYANVNSSGVMPTNHYVKNNLSFRQASSFFNNRLTVSSNVMLTMEQLHNTILNGYYWNPLLGLYNFPRGLDFTYYKDNYQILDTDRNLMVQNWPISGNAEAQMNPYWILNNDPDDTKTKRVIVNLSVKYSLFDGLSLSARGNYDYTNQLYEMKAKATSSSVLVSENGRYIYSNLTSSQTYGDLLLTLDKQILGNDISLHALVGAAYQKEVIGDGLVIDSQTYGLTIVNQFTIQNIASLLAFSNSQQVASRIIKQSVFGNLSIGYKGKVYLDLSGRNDWASSLAFTKHPSYFYPSVGVSFILTDLMELPKFINFAKLRESFARVGNEIPAFISNPTGSVSANGYTGNFVKAFNDLKPEMSNNFETGLDLGLFHNRLGIDFTCYQIDSRDQYLQLEAPSGSGYTSYYVNAGNVRSRGIELCLNATPFSYRDFIWSSSLNYSRNRNRIISLSDDLTGYYQLPGGGEGYEMKVVTGGSMGDIYTYAYVRDANGSIVLDEEHIPEKTTVEKKIGSANPSWMLGWNNTIKYKGVELSLLIDGKFGGKFVSMSQAYLDANGVTKSTADARNNGGVWVSGSMADGSSWSGVVDAKAYYTGTAGRGGIMEQYVYDATNVRLRQAVLAYTFNVNKSRRTRLKNMTLSLILTNPCYLYKRVPGNPNATISTGNGTQSVENFGLPPVRNFAFNIKMNI